MALDGFEGYFLVVLKSYFDGGNQADSREYDIVTLAAFSGTAAHWKKFNDAWTQRLTKHRAPYLHTTDAIGLTRDFSRRDGWDETRVNSLVSDCVSVIEKCAAVRKGKRIATPGLRPVTVTVILKDFKRALLEIPDLGSVEHLCATQCVGYCFAYGHHIGADTFQLFFDQGEPFYGHIHDRMTNRKSKATDTFWQRVTHLGEPDMEHMPPLQAADLLAWSVNHAHEDGRIRYEWQERILNIEREKDWFDYPILKEPNLKLVDEVKGWKLPRRRAVR